MIYNMQTDMLHHTRHLLLALLVSIMPALVSAQTSYAPAKVVYDVTAVTVKEINHLLDRAVLLQKTYHDDSFAAEIVLVIHDRAIPLFAKTKESSQQILKRAKSLTLGEIIKFKLCAASARMQGFKTAVFPAFIEIVPMADAEIIQLQNQSYAYLR